MNTWQNLRSDVLLAIRRLRDAPGFAFICIATLAIGIGGNTAVFTLVDRVILQPLPVQRPSELFRLGDTYDCCVNSGLPGSGSFSLFSYDLYAHLKADAPEFTELAAFQANVRTIAVGRPEPDAPGETLNAAFVSGNYFQMLGLSAAVGRLADASDDRLGASPVAVISYTAWDRRFQKRPDVVGRTLLFNGVATTIIGVTPDGFYGETLRPDPADVWIPLSNEPQMQPPAKLLHAKASHWLYVIGRMKSDAAIPALESRLTARLQQWLASTVELSAADRDRLPKQHITVVPAPSGVGSLREEVTPSLKLLQAVAAAVLLIACANLANLLLARGMARRTETAVRVALGATRGRLVTQFLTEAVLLSCAGGLAGLVVAHVGARTIIDLAFRGASNVPVDPSPSPTVVLFAFAVAMLTALVFGTAPALAGSRSDPIDAMRGAGRSTAGRDSKVRQSLVALQVALSLVLIMCAGLLARSLDNLQKQQFGFRADGLYAAALAPSLAVVPPDRLESLYARTRERLERISGVAGAAFSLYSPMSGDNWSSSITVDGQNTSERLVASWNRVSPGYFDTIGTPLLRGRSFDDRDGSAGPPVAIVSQTFAERFFGKTDPIGRRIGFGNSSGTARPDMEIVGVVGDTKYQDGRRPAYPTFFMPFLQRLDRGGPQPVRLDRSHYAQALVVRAERAVPALEGEIRRALAEIDGRLTIRTVRPMHEEIAGHFNLERLLSRLTIAFGSVALLLACLGIYGVTAYSVSRRTQEIGIRMAVGASRPQVLGTILRGAFVQLVIGLAMGLPAAFAAGQLLESTLFGVSAHDPLVLGAGLTVLAIATAIAAFVPARRAATMDPVRALRVE